MSSPSCCTPQPTNCTSSSALGPSRHPSGAGWPCGCPQGHGCGPPAPAAAGLDLASESSSRPTAWPMARRPRGANVWITVRFKEHPAGYHGVECWAKENQECWTRCNCRKGCGQKALTAERPARLRPQRSLPYVLMGWGPSDLSSGSSHSLAAPSGGHDEKCSPSPARWCTKQDMDGTGEQPPRQPAAGCWKGRDEQKRCCLSSWRHHTCQSKVRKPQTFSNFYSQQQAFTAFSSSAVVAPILQVQVPQTGMRAGHVRIPMARWDHSYPLCADGTLQTLRSWKTGWQA